MLQGLATCSNLRRDVTTAFLEVHGSTFGTFHIRRQSQHSYHITPLASSCARGFIASTLERWQWGQSTRRPDDPPFAVLECGAEKGR